MKWREQKPQGGWGGQGGGRECSGELARAGTEGWVKLEGRVGQAAEVEGHGNTAPLQVMAKHMKGSGKLLEDISSIFISIPLLPFVEWVRETRRAVRSYLQGLQAKGWQWVASARTAAER